MKSGLNNERMLQYNRRALLFHLFCLEEAGISRLAQALELSVPAVSRIVKSLRADGLVRLEEGAGGGRGHSAGVVKLNTPYRHILCMDVRPTEIRSVLCSIFGKPQSACRHRPLSLGSKEELIEALVAEIDFYRKDPAFDCADLRCTALAFHGQVDPKNGVSLMMPQAPWRDELHVKYLLEKRLQLEVCMDNDCVMRALAQKWQLLRTQGECHDLCVLNVDYGVGSSFLINQEIYRGQLFGSGQIGHTIIDPNGRLCSCGRIGCLETVASTGAVCRAVNQYLQALNGTQEKLEFEEIAARYRKGDPSVSVQVNTAAISLGRSIYNFLNIININHIYIYGAVRLFGDKFLELIKRQIRVNPFDKGDQVKELATSIEFGSLSEAEQISGISYLVGERLYKLPEDDDL